MSKHHQDGADGAGHYEARADHGQGMTFGGSVRVVRTVAPAVYWVPDEGKEVRAWLGQGYTAHPTSKRKSEQSVMFLARNKCEVLRNYYKLNGRRWELVVTEERQQKEMLAAAERRARHQVQKTAPRLLAALKAMVADPGNAKARLEALDAITEAESPPTAEEAARARQAWPHRVA